VLESGLNARLSADEGGGGYMIHQWIPDDSVKSLCFVSDLHLFSDRCNWNEHQHTVQQVIEASDLVIWGGDLFDFRWSRLGSEKHSIRESFGWLERWLRLFPSKTYLYLDGNHDAHLPFRRELQRWGDDQKNFHCGYDCLRIGNTLFTHGDVIEGRGNLQSFRDYRARWENRSTASSLASRAYDLAVAVRAHQAAALAVNRRRSTCLRLLHWMNQQPSEQVAGIQRIVFGHTHRRIDAYEVAGIRFYNGGAAIRHVPFCPVVLDYRE